MQNCSLLLPVWIAAVACDFLLLHKVRSDYALLNFACFMEISCPKNQCQYQYKDVCIKYLLELTKPLYFCEDSKGTCKV